MHSIAPVNKVSEVGKGEGFIYSSGGLQPVSAANSAEQADGSKSPRCSAPPRYVTDLWPGPTLDPELQGLLEYFIDVASGTMSSHESVRSETCRVLLPIATNAPSLLSALLALSAAHRSSVDDCSGTKPHWTGLAKSLKLQSIQSLRHEMQAATGESLQVVVATSLMLCQSVLAYDLEDYNTWRVFLSGARTAMCNADMIPGGGTTIRYLKKRFRLLEAIAMLSPQGFPASDLLADMEDDHTGISPVFMDDAAGCSTDVFKMLRVVSAAVWERDRLDVSPAGSSILTLQDLLQEASALEQQLLWMIESDPHTTLGFPPGIQETLKPEQIDEFRVCNRIFQHTALIYLRAGVMRIPSSNEEIQSSVREVIRLASSASPPRALSPYLGLNTAIFIAGCHSTGH